MKAVTYRQYGAPDVLNLEEVEQPVPGDDEILIKTFAAEATKADCELRSFRFAVNWFWLPLRVALGITRPKRPILGGYFSGMVEQTGKDVTRFKPGDAVFGSTQLRFGAYGEYLCLPESYSIAIKPEKISFAEAAAVPLGGFNALHFMNLAEIRPGEKVLINGAGGSIGTFAIQIARARGAEVTAVDSGIKEDMLRRTGADYFFDYTREDFSRSGRSYDVIFDMVADSSYSACIDSLKPDGRYLIGNPRLSDMLRSVITQCISNMKVFIRFAGETHEELETLKTMLENDQLRPVIDTIYPLERVAEAHRRVETEQRLGIVVISLEAE